MAIQTGTTTRSAAAPPQINWATVMATLKAAFSDKVNEWIANASVDADDAKQTGTILQQTAMMKRGSLVSQVTAPVASIRETLVGLDGMTRDIAAALAEEVWHAWSEWAAEYWLTIVVPHWADFNAYAAAQTPPRQLSPDIPGVKTPQFMKVSLLLGGSNGENRLSASQLSTHILNRLRPLLPSPSSGAAGTSSSALQSTSVGSGAQRAAMMTQATAPANAALSTNVVQQGMLALNRTSAAGSNPSYNVPVLAVDPFPAAQSAVNELASWINEKFHAWKGTARISNLWGQGRVPSFAPPYVPVGPVVGGKIWGSNVLSGPPFPWQ